MNATSIMDQVTDSMKEDLVEKLVADGWTTAEAWAAADDPTNWTEYTDGMVGAEVTTARGDNSKVYTATLEAFINSPDFVEGVTSGTQAGFGGSGYSVELFEDGTWRVLWDNQIGNLYQTPGIILALPKWEDEDWASWQAENEAPYDYDDSRAAFLREYLVERLAGER